MGLVIKSDDIKVGAVYWKRRTGKGMRDDSHFKLMKDEVCKIFPQFTENEIKHCCHKLSHILTRANHDIYNFYIRKSERSRKELPGYFSGYRFFVGKTEVFAYAQCD